MSDYNIDLDNFEAKTLNEEESCTNLNVKANRTSTFTANKGISVDKNASLITDNVSTITINKHLKCNGDSTITANNVSTITIYGADLNGHTTIVAKKTSTVTIHGNVKSSTIDKDNSSTVTFYSH